MNFKNLINNVTESVKNFDFKAAGQTVVDTAKTTGTVLSEKGKEIKTHYRDLKAANVKIERIDKKVAFCVDATIIAEFKHHKAATKAYVKLVQEALQNQGYVKITIGDDVTNVPLEHIAMMPLSEAYNL